jgi:hypothetical protein
MADLTSSSVSQQQGPQELIVNVGVTTEVSLAQEDALTTVITSNNWSNSSNGDDTYHDVKNPILKKALSSDS